TALAGRYKVRLTVDGKTSTASLTVKMDPRVKTPAIGLQKKFQAETKLAALFSQSSLAVRQARSIHDRLEELSAADHQGKVDVERADKKLSALLGTQAGFLAPPATEATLTRV